MKSLDYARRCLRVVGRETALDGLTVPAELDVPAGWRDSHLAGLVGTPSQVVDCPLPLPQAADGVMLALRALLSPAAHSSWLGRRILGMRRLSHPLRRAGTTSPGGSCRLLAAADGWLAVNLARGEDWEVLPAWLESAAVSDWGSVTAAVADRSCAELRERATWLGLPVAISDERRDATQWFQVRAQGPRRARRDQQSVPRVLDLSALWAGPLCTQLLRQSGAQVVKVEQPGRPDGARSGPAAFFSTLHAGKAELQLDLNHAADRQRLEHELTRADIVVESLRPRVLPQFGIHPEAWLQRRPGLTWVSLTGYGHQAPDDARVAFGDDAAVAAGLSARMQELCGEHLIVGDAIADPLAGMHAALAATASHQAGGGQLLSIALSDVVAQVLAWATRQAGSHSQS